MIDPVTGLSLGRIVLGAVSVLKPALVTGSTGAGGSSTLLTQAFGSREMALGAATLLVPGARRRMLGIGVAVDAADAATAYAAVRNGTVPQPLGIGLTVVAVAAVGTGVAALVSRSGTPREP